MLSAGTTSPLPTHFALSQQRFNGKGGWMRGR
jgi:hypothetical protein